MVKFFAMEKRNIIFVAICCAWALVAVESQMYPPNAPLPQPFLPPQNPNFGPNQFGFASNQANFFGVDRRNLYPYGAGTYDVKLVGREAQTGRQVNMFTFFPYYGARFNYSIISIHGYITFGNLMENGLDFLMGDEVKNWPTDSDPATMAILACRQRELDSVPFDQKGLYYRLVFREDMFKSIPGGIQNNPQMQAQNYIDPRGDYFLDQLQYDLQDGMVGASNFRADAALVVTWENVTFFQASPSDEGSKRATFQAVWMTDRAAQLSYVILNYHTVGYAGGDILGQSRRGRCLAQFNGGNQTGVVLVDPMYSKFPMQLAQMSAVPHRVGGRYLFRVDDIVRRGGCSNMTTGTYRMTIYPDLVNAMGDTNVQINAKCFRREDQPLLQIAEYKPSICKVKNAAIAECKMVKYYHWGTKQVFLDVDGNKAYIGSIYYVPPGLDPFQLEIGQTETWFSKKRPPQHVILWWPGNFTNERNERVGSLRLSLWGYKERRDDNEKRFIPVLEKIAVLNSGVPNPTDRMMVDKATYYFTAQTPQWVDNGERDFWTYRFGLLRLSVDDALQAGGEGGGLWSPPIPLHFWYGTDERNIERISNDKCMEWYHEDGNQWNFIMDTETNSSCPCRESQALMDIGRYLPHPRCSQIMRTLNCDAYIGAKNCFLSAQNIQGNYVTHYGQVCCYDRDGYLMQTSYQSVVQIENYPYSPGFPQRAYEFGTYPYTKQFEIPTLSNYYHDVMPYFFCCKFVPDHCQFFYWRRPSSGCQNYRPPGVSFSQGAGHFVTFDGLQYTFNEPGTYVLLHRPEIKLQYNRDVNQRKAPEVMIQVRMERFPNRMVDFSHRDLMQHELVQPTNVSVITGIAIQEGSVTESDRVIISLRKDTRRVKYRLNVLVNDEIRYFDVVRFQKYRGVMVYVNSWKEGQSEMYVALEQSRIGLRIRESYAAEIVRQLKFEESYGLLDVMVSVPPEFMMIPDPSGALYWENSVAGLVGTFSNTTQDDFVDPTTRRPMGSSSGSSESVNTFVRMWRVNNPQDFNRPLDDTHKFEDLFRLVSQTHDTWPEAMLIGPVYPYSRQIDLRRPFVQQYDTIFEQNYMHCQAMYNDPYCPDQKTMNDILDTCKGMQQCRYDYFETQQKVLGSSIQREYAVTITERMEGMRRFNSCGAINVEYPEYLIIQPATSKLYLEGDQVQFDCYQDHWPKGEKLFTCLQGGWTKGSQPWCRSKKLENTQKILAIVFGILIFLLLIAAIFACCFCMRRNRKRTGRAYRTGEPINRNALNQPTGKTEPKVTVSTAESRPLMAGGLQTKPATLGQYDAWEPERERDERRQAAGGQPARPSPIVGDSNGSSPASYMKPPPTYNSSPRTNGKLTLV